MSRNVHEEGWSKQDGSEACPRLASLIFCTFCGAANQDAASHCFACDHALFSEGEPTIGTPTTTSLHAGRYLILSILGQGGYSAVYKAADTRQHDLPVAIKSVNLRGLSASEVIDATETFNREWTLLSELSHPNLPRLHEHFSDPEHWYLVMDFIDGQTLESYLQVCYSYITAGINNLFCLVTHFFVFS